MSLTALDPSSPSDGNATGQVSSSQDAATCASTNCDQSVVPGSSYCGREDHSSSATGQSDGTQGPTDPVGTADGTGRSHKPRWSTRALSAADRRELRVVAQKSGTVTVEGYALRYNASYDVNDMFGTFTEVMRRGAAAGVVNGDTRFLVNHTGIPLARTQSGTLDLEDDDVGLRIRADLDVANNTVSKDVAACIDRGDMSQMSIGFVVAKNGDTWNEDYTYRQISRIGELLDVSPVTYPASPTTHIQIARDAAADGNARARLLVKRERARRDQLVRRLSPAARAAWNDFDRRSSR